MSERVAIYLKGEMPDDLAQAWLQHLRDFDTAHPGCHFEVVADAPGWSMADFVAVARVNPGMPFIEIIERMRPKP
jgi:hypothetical protein